jgi:hypothetical protein
LSRRELIVLVVVIGALASCGYSLIYGSDAGFIAVTDRFFRTLYVTACIVFLRLVATDNLEERTAVRGIAACFLIAFSGAFVVSFFRQDSGGLSLSTLPILTAYGLREFRLRSAGKAVQGATISGLREFLSLLTFAGLFVSAVTLLIAWTPGSAYLSQNDTIRQLEYKLVLTRKIAGVFSLGSWQIALLMTLLVVLGAFSTFRYRSEFFIWLGRYMKWTGRAYATLTILASVTFFGAGMYFGPAQMGVRIMKQIDSLDRGYADITAEARKAFNEILAQELIEISRAQPAISDTAELLQAERELAWRTLNTTRRVEPVAEVRASLERMKGHLAHSELPTPRESWSALEHSRIKGTMRELTDFARKPQKNEVNYLLESAVDLLYKNTAEAALEPLLKHADAVIPVHLALLLLKPFLAKPVKTKLNQVFEQYLQDIFKGHTEDLLQRVHASIRNVVSAETQRASVLAINSYQPVVRRQLQTVKRELLVQDAGKLKWQELRQRDPLEYYRRRMRGEVPWDELLRDAYEEDRRRGRSAYESAEELRRRTQPRPRPGR